MLKLLLGDPNARKLKRYHPIVSDINLLEEDIELLCPMMSFAARQPLSRSVWPTLAASRTSDRSSMRSSRRRFAVVREAGKRVLGMRHFDVQLIGGMVLHEGQIAEMKTGEGKTLVATLAELPQRPYRPWCPCGDGERLFGPP